MNFLRKKIRLKDIAEALNVSTTTVSFCLNGEGERYQVAPETIRKVCEYAEKNGYCANRNARSLRCGGPRTIGFLTNSHCRAGQKYIGPLFDAERILKASNIETHHLSTYNQQEGIAGLHTLGCDEIIIFDPVSETRSIKTDSDVKKSDQLFSQLQFYAVDYTMPILPESEQFSHMMRCGVAVQEFQEKLVKMLLDAYPGEALFHEWRCSREAIKKLNVPSELIFQYASEDPIIIGKFAAHQYLEMRKTHHITSAFWGDDRMAMGFISELLIHKVRIPEELNVVSFDNLDFAQFLPIPLTTWTVPVAKHTRLVLEKILYGKGADCVISKPVFAPGRSARLTDAMLRELHALSDSADENDIYQTMFPNNP